MSEDRFAGIEEKLNTLVSGQADLQAGQQAMEAGQQSLEIGQHALQAGQTRIEARLGKVEITQEAMRDEIKQIAEGHGATQAGIARGFETLRDHIDRKIDPFILAVQEHSAILAAHGLTLPSTDRGAP